MSNVHFTAVTNYVQYIRQDQREVHSECVNLQRRGNRGGNGGARPRNAEIICQVYQLVDSQTSISLSSFKILMRT